MRQVRQSVFETNSSSTHTITVAHTAELQPSALRTDINGYVRARFGEWGWSFPDIETQDEKLSYLLTLARIKTGCDECIWSPAKKKKDKRNFEVTREFHAISDAVAKHTENCVGIRIDIDDYSEGEIDHQSHEEFDSLDDFLAKYGTTIEEFIFGEVKIDDGGGGD